MMMVATYSFLFLTMLTLISSESLRVLRTTKDLSTFHPYSGGELLNSSVYDFEEATICARFSTYQFITHGYQEPLQVVLSIGQNLDLLSSYTMLPQTSQFWAWWHNLIGSKWQHGNVLAFNNVGSAKIFPIWNMGSQIWNSVCIVSSLTGRFYKIVINENIVYEGKEFDGFHKKVDKIN